MRMLSEGARNSLESRTQEFHEALDGARSYLSRRGLTAETADRFRLGFDGERLVIPYLTPEGPVSLKRRCIQDHDCKEHGHPKYLYEAGEQLHLFNAQTLLNAKAVMVTEGEIDAMTIEQLGVPAVAYPGVASWRQCGSYWRWCFDSVDEVFVIGDGDEPGTKAANTVSAALRDSVAAEIYTVILPPGQDANSFITTYGEDAFLVEASYL
jgi:DNA primase